jgi:hypothetical protein
VLYLASERYGFSAVHFNPRSARGSSPSLNCLGGAMSNKMILFLDIYMQSIEHRRCFVPGSLKRNARIYVTCVLYSLSCCCQATKESASNSETQSGIKPISMHIYATSLEFIDVDFHLEENHRIHQRVPIAGRDGTQKGFLWWS